MSRPRVVTCNLVSVDARLTLAPGVNLMAGDPRWSELVEDLGDPYRWPRDVHDPELLLEGAGSFVSHGPTDLVPAAADGPEGEHFLPEAVLAAPGRRWFAVVDGRGEVDVRFTEWPDEGWAGWHALVLTSHAAPARHLATLRERGIPYLVVGREHVHLPRALELLHDRLAVRTVVCTGGGRLGGTLLRQGLVDEVNLEVLPAVIGGRGTPMLFDAEPLVEDEAPLRLELVSAQTLPRGRIRLRYAAVR